MRKLPAAAQEERRRQVIGLRQSGMTYQAIAELVGLSPTGVLNICHRFAAEGAKGLVSKPRGRKPGEQRLLNPAQEAEVQALIRRHTSDELGLPFALWNRAAGICQRSRRTCRREVNAEFCLRRLENGERTGGATEVNEATASGGNMLVVAGVGRRKSRSSS